MRHLINIRKYLIVIQTAFYLFGCFPKKEVRMEYYKNGKIKSKIEFVNGLKNGESRMFDSLGNLMSITHFINDTLHGDKISYYKNGNILMKISYVKGVADGPFFHYYENGYMAKKGNFKKGRRHGLLHEYFSHTSELLNFESYVINFEGNEFAYFIKEYNEGGQLINDRRAISIELSNSEILIGQILNVTLRVHLTDSCFAVVGDFDEFFDSYTTIDTVLFQNGFATYSYSPKFGGQNYLRGYLISHKKDIEADSIIEIFNYFPFEEVFTVIR